jgi:trans-aconitate methyltransferase
VDAVAARELIAHPSLLEDGPQVWADLGCGDGTFTRALAACLPAGSRIHAVDRDASALRAIPNRVGGVAVTTVIHDVTADDLPLSDLDGVLIANALHYVRDQAGWLTRLRGRLRRLRLLLVEYDSARANRWVPYPVPLVRAEALLASAGFDRLEPLGRRASVYRDADLYALLATASTPGR